MLAGDPDVKRLHTELVSSGIVSEEEFWRSRQAMILEEASRQAQRTGLPTGMMLGQTVRLNSSIIKQVVVVFNCFPAFFPALFCLAMSGKCSLRCHFYRFRAYILHILAGSEFTALFGCIDILLTPDIHGITRSGAQLSVACSAPVY